MLVTNRRLDAFSHRQLARQVHMSMARAIQPFSTWADGDVLFVATTGELNDFDLGVTDLGAIASELAWDAVLNCFEQTPDNLHDKS
jgi:L-aminopeptidase/D-esterase-like protein